jgi:predicted house-cleaning noncanonical NTP pyrophosphatase (MazG superfamily)
MKVYKKLVRDNIPAIIERSGKVAYTRILEEEEFKAELDKKLVEEVNEYAAAETKEERLEELADILEVIQAIAGTQNAAMEDIECVKQQKAEMNGAFENKIFLLAVREQGNI